MTPNQQMKTNPSLSQPGKTMQTQNTINNNKPHQSFGAQQMNSNMSLSNMIGINNMTANSNGTNNPNNMMLDNKNQNMPNLNSMMTPITTINDKNVLNLLPFDDPVEQSLASLEQSLGCKFK